MTQAARIKKTYTKRRTKRNPWFMISMTLLILWACQLFLISINHNELMAKIDSLTIQVTELKEDVDQLLKNQEYQMAQPKDRALPARLTEDVVGSEYSIEYIPDNVIDELTMEPVEEFPEEVIKVEPVFNPNDITQKSNLTLEQMHIITEGTRYVGYEELLLELEEDHNVNVIFAMANSILECGYTNTTSYTKRNNLFGLNNSTFQSYEDCLRYYFNLINKSYVNKRNLVSIESIQPIYCPPNKQWDNDITSIGRKLLSKVNSTVD